MEQHTLLQQAARPRQRRMGFAEAVRAGLKHYAGFRGRASRAEYWWFTLFAALLVLAAQAVAADWLRGPAAALLPALVQLGLLLPRLAVGARRLHDTNRSGWWLLISLTLVGLIPLWIFFSLPSQPAANRYGQVPGLETDRTA